MARISRKLQKIFALLASNNGKFGSAQDGSKITTNDLDLLQELPAFDEGWLSATISGSRLPPLEEMQALHYITTTQLAYLFQEGLAEYNIETEYHTNSVVRKTGTYELYGSIGNDNIGNALPSQVNDANWQYLVDLGNISGGGTGVPVGAVETYTNLISIPSDRLICDGSTFSSITYPDLAIALGGTTLPDYRGEFLRGADQGRGVDTGRVIGSTQSDELKSHTHTTHPISSTAVSGSGGFWPVNNQTGATGSTGGAETRPRNIAIIYTMKAE